MRSWTALPWQVRFRRSSGETSPDELLELRQLAAQWGKIVARRAFGDDGPGLDIDFATMERIARVAAQGLTEGTLQTLLDRHTAALGDEQPCPDCGTPCPGRRHERPLHAQGVELRQSEPDEHLLHDLGDDRPRLVPETTAPAGGAAGGKKATGGSGKAKGGKKK